PYWGSRNGSHTAEVVWNAQKGRMYDGVELYFTNTRRRPAKVIRHTFHKIGAFTQSIAPLLDGEVVQIPQMRGECWFDVTADHCPAADVMYPIGDGWPSDKKLGYIYVLSYGRWVPTYYGTIENDSLRFRSMGLDIIYRVGYYADGDHQFISRPLLVDQQGELRYSLPDPERAMSIQTPKINDGEKDGVEAGADYTLKYQVEDGYWQ